MKNKEKMSYLSKRSFLYQSGKFNKYIPFLILTERLTRHFANETIKPSLSHEPSKFDVRAKSDILFKFTTEKPIFTGDLSNTQTALPDLGDSYS